MKVNFSQGVKTVFNKVKDTAQDMGQGTIQWVSKQNDRFDEFVKQKGANPQTVKQIGVGAAVLLGGLGLSIALFKSLKKNVDEEIKK